MTLEEHRMSRLGQYADRYWKMYEWSRVQGYLEMANRYREELARVQMQMANLYVVMLAREVGA